MINKKNLAVTVMFTFLLLASFSFVLAQPAGSGPADLSAGKPVTNPQWLIEVAEFLKIGGEQGTIITWQGLFIGLAVLLMLFAMIYEILSFTPFETGWVKYLIAGGVALITSISGGVNSFAATIATWIGGSAMLGGFAVIAIAIVFFIIGGFFKAKFKAMKAKAKGTLAEAGYDAMAAGDAARARAAFKMAKEVDKL